MQFRKEVQEQFKKAGWYPGRSVREKFDAIPRFHEFPQMAREFLYEYGDLDVPTLTQHAVGILNTKALLQGYYKIEEYLSSPAYYGNNLMTFPLADYPLDAACMECDAEGRIYIGGDFPGLISNHFIEGIEKVIMEDYSNTLKWDEEKSKWGKGDYE